jgi:hypothetical protein
MAGMACIRIGRAPRSQPPTHFFRATLAKSLRPRHCLDKFGSLFRLVDSDRGN